MSRFIFGESRWPHGGAMVGGGGGCHPLNNSTTSNFDEIWAIYVNFPEKNNRSCENSVGGPLSGVGGAAAPIKHFAWLNALAQEGLHQSN